MKTVEAEFETHSSKADSSGAASSSSTKSKDETGSSRTTIWQSSGHMCQF